MCGGSLGGGGGGGAVVRIRGSGCGGSHLSCRSQASTPKCSSEQRCVLVMLLSGAVSHHRRHISPGNIPCQMFSFCWGKYKQYKQQVYRSLLTDVLYLFFFKCMNTHMYLICIMHFRKTHAALLVAGSLLDSQGP